MSDQPTKRFDLVPNYRCGGVIDEMEPHDYGDWVRYEDYEKVAAQLAATHAAIRALPRYELSGNRMFPLSDEARAAYPTIGVVAWQALSGLLGDPEGPPQTETKDDQSRVDGDTQALRRQDLPQSGNGR